jgi:hypothetical protein
MIAMASTVHRSLKSQSAHRWQTFWQIIFPLVAGVGLAAWGLTALMGAQAGNVTRMSQIATVVMLVPVLLIGVVLLVITIALIYLLGRVMNWIPPQTYRLQRGVQAVSSRVISTTDALMRPVIGLQSWLHAANTLIKRRR